MSLASRFKNQLRCFKCGSIYWGVTYMYTYLCYIPDVESDWERGGIGSLWWPQKLQLNRRPGVTGIRRKASWGGFRFRLTLVRRMTRWVRMNRKKSLSIRVPRSALPIRLDVISLHRRHHFHRLLDLTSWWKEVGQSRRKWNWWSKRPTWASKPLKSEASASLLTYPPAINPPARFRASSSPAAAHLLQFRLRRRLSSAEFLLRPPPRLPYPLPRRPLTPRRSQSDAIESPADPSHTTRGRPAQL